MADEPKVKRERIFLYAPSGRVQFGDYFIVSNDYKREAGLIIFYSGRTFGTDEGYELPPIDEIFGEAYDNERVINMGKVRK